LSARRIQFGSGESMGLILVQNVTDVDGYTHNMHTEVTIIKTEVDMDSIQLGVG
jgi:hypothetical protein